MRISPSTPTSLLMERSSRSATISVRRWFATCPCLRASPLVALSARRTRSSSPVTTSRLSLSLLLLSRLPPPSLTRIFVSSWTVSTSRRRSSLRRAPPLLPRARLSEQLIGCK
eukprot:Mycagemm_TRINITY_DN2797_c0_g1::TRINITY_DN2797_c0_g1_i1::g.1691::m.1691 type:complete len:113 gc:universal TRINITY_DN2797_c0_g1_i1:346-684(+)